MLQTAHPRDETFDAHAKAGVRNRAVFAQIQVPFEGFARKLVFFQALQQQVQIMDALPTADNFAIPFRGDEIDAQSDLRAVLRRREVEGFDASRKPVHDHGPLETVG